MIKENELRIGSRLLYHVNEDGIEWDICTIDWQDLKWISEDPEGFNNKHKPVPLTEEWLLKFGFVKNTYPNLHWFKCIDNGDKFSIVEHRQYYSNKHLSFYFNCGGLNNYSSIDLQLINLHHLQTLYFALTGEELKPINN